MRARWKILCGLCATSVAIGLLGHSRVVNGDTLAPSATDSAATTTAPNDPFKPYGLGPGAIPYEQLSAHDKADVDVVEERLDVGQPATSVMAFGHASTQMDQLADAQLLARSVGLSSTEQDGVVP